MKKPLLPALAVCVVSVFATPAALSQDGESNKVPIDADKLKALADFAVKSFTWKIQKDEHGHVMSLDVPFHRENQDTEHLTLTVSKATGQERPDFISVVVPNNVVQSNGVFVKFSTGTGLHRDLEKGLPVRLPFDSCDENKKICTANIVSGYAPDKENQKVDIFKKFMDFDHVLFLVVYPDGSHKSVAIPLFKFKEQYAGL